MKKFILLMILSFFTLYTSVYSQQWTVVSSPSLDPMRNILRGVGAVSSNDVWSIRAAAVIYFNLTLGRGKLDNY